MSRSETDKSVLATLLGCVPFAYAEDGDLILTFRNGELWPTGGNVIIIYDCSDVMKAGMEHITVTRGRRTLYEHK
jgi:hypothetical protein